MRTFIDEHWLQTHCTSRSQDHVYWREISSVENSHWPPIDPTRKEKHAEVVLFERLPHAQLALSLSSCLPASSWNGIRESGTVRRDYAARRLPSSTRCRGEPRLDRLGTRELTQLGRAMRRLCHFPLHSAGQSRAVTSAADQCAHSATPMLGRKTSLAHEVLCSLAPRTSFSCFCCLFVVDIVL